MQSGVAPFNCCVLWSNSQLRNVPCVTGWAVRQNAARGKRRELPWKSCHLRAEKAVLSIMMKSEIGRESKYPAYTRSIEFLQMSDLKNTIRPVRLRSSLLPQI